MICPAPGQPACTKAIVNGYLPDFVLALNKSGAVDGTMMELKNSRPTKTITTRQKALLDGAWQVAFRVCALTSGYGEHFGPGIEEGCEEEGLPKALDAIMSERPWVLPLAKANVIPADCTGVD